ncbi:MAG: hypothetical protein IPK20_21680 [Betaproteobacteria bacterium]|nr:hypothetical protein [Betaproteobacteria bacterium]
MIEPLCAGVNTEEFTLDLLGSRVEICPSVGLRLFRDSKDRQVRADVLGEPGLVDLKVVMGNADSNPASPRVINSTAHW